MKQKPFDSDLACERRRADASDPGIRLKKEKRGSVLTECIEVYNDEGAKSIDRPIGKYQTLHIKRLDEISEEEKRDAVLVLADELCAMLPPRREKPRRLFIVGLGNPDLTADAVGPLTAERIHATLHLEREYPSLFAGFSCDGIAVIAPGVTAKTGMDAAVIVKEISKKTKADAVIAVDALAAGSVERLGTTIQISNTGIFPGSGVGNRKLPLNERTVGVPVVAIGVPTVVSASALIREAVGNDDFKQNAESKFDKMFVSPKEADEIVKTASEIISDAVNQTFGIEF